MERSLTYIRADVPECEQAPTAAEAQSQLVDHFFKKGLWRTTAVMVNVLECLLLGDVSQGFELV